jgi:type II secretory pathway pseudopilin PulG
MHIKYLNNTGDTIIEVLVCIAVVSTILGGAFVTTRQSQVGVRNSQEHAEALKLVESQLEQLRGDTAQVTTYTTPFCMYNETPVSAVIAPQDADCTQDSGGLAKQSDSRYYLTIARCTAIACGNNIAGSYLFTVTATWTQVTGQGNGQESMVYRLY